MIQIDKDVVIKNIAKVVNEKCPSFSGIVSQMCKGNLWVDNIETPTLALAESYAVGGFAFLGTYNSKVDFIDLKRFLETELFLQIKERGCNCFEFSVESDSIRKHILELFQDKQLQSEKEFSFRANKIPIFISNTSADYQILNVDLTFWNALSKVNIENSDFIKTRIMESWHSFEEFEHRSIAYCAIYKNRIVAAIVGTANFNNIIPIDIATEEKHRRKGLAYALVVEFIAACFKNNYVPQWDCVESNTTSYHLAQKLGFEKINENTVYWFDI